VSGDAPVTCGIWWRILEKVGNVLIVWTSSFFLVWLSFRDVKLEAFAVAELNKIFYAHSSVKVCKFSDVLGTDFASIFMVLLMACST
jgi:hypothetical protein